MKAFRIGGGGHPVFDGTGAGRNGARWNSPGRAVIYAGSSFAIAMLERLVNASIGRVPADSRWVEITIPDDVPMETLDPASVPGWSDLNYAVSRRHGDRWYDERRSAVLAVPSVVTRIDLNLIINPGHADFARIIAASEQRVIWDRRLFARPA